MSAVDNPIHRLAGESPASSDAGTEGASGLMEMPVRESLRSMDPARFHLWKVARQARNADGASPK